MIRTILAIAFLATSSAAWAQGEDEGAKLRKSILDKVKARIEEEHKKILDKVGKIIDEELAKEPVKVPTELERKIADLEKKLKDMDLARAAAAKELEELKKQAKAPPKPPPADDEEAKIKADAKKNGPQSIEDAADLFREAFQDHEGKDFKSSVLKFKYVYYQFPQHELGMASAYNVACGYALAGDKAKACDWLEISFKAGYADYEHVKKDTDLDSIRQEKKYKQLLADK
jgi:hypothetical protein